MKHARLLRWWTLPVRDRLVFLALLAALPVTALLLRVAGVVRTRRWIEWVSNGDVRPATERDLSLAERLASLVELAGRRGLVPVTCLRQSLLLYLLLRRRGLAPKLKFGVQILNTALDAHAWVELQGVALGQPSLVHIPFEDGDWNSIPVR